MKRKCSSSDLKFSHKGKPGLEPLADKYGLALLVLLGSYGTDRFVPGRSDIDIAFLSRKYLPPDSYLQLMADISAYFQYGRLDLIDLKKASGLLKYEIADKGRLLFQSRQGCFERYKLYCLRYYYDTSKFRDLRRVFFQEQLGVLKDA